MRPIRCSRHEAVRCMVRRIALSDREMAGEPMAPDDQLNLDQIQNQLSLHSILHGFLGSTVIVALVDLHVFELLSEGALSLNELSRRTGVGEDHLARLLRAAQSLELVECNLQGEYQVPVQLQGLLGQAGREGTMTAWVRFLRSVAGQLFDVADVVRNGPSRLEEDDFCLHGVDLSAFSQAMHDYACSLGSELVRFLDLSQVDSLLDLGCGSGTYACLLGQSYPQLSLHLIDSPEVLEIARQTVGEFGLSDRVQFHEADVLRDRIPGKYDVILISNVLHLIGRSQAEVLVCRCFDSVQLGGSLVIHGQFLTEGKNRWGWPVMLDLILLAGSLSGQNHTSAEAAAWLARAGFEEIEVEPMSLYNANSFVRGFKKR